MGLDKSSEAIIIGVLVPSLLFLLIVAGVCLRRMRIRGSPVGTSGGYSQVDHELDEEEIQFKKSIELVAGNNDGFDGFDDDDFEELQFDSKELDRLSMLEKYRSNLVAASTSSTEKDDKLDERMTDDLRL